METFLLIIFAFLFVITLVFNYASFHLSKRAITENVSEEFIETKNLVVQYKNIFAFFSLFVFLFYLGYYFTVKYHVESHVLEWLNLIVRWAHVVFGIAWIGASFYFIFLENSLNRTENLRDELAGNLWAIHGGGFSVLFKLFSKKIK